MQTIQLFKDNKQILGSDGVMKTNQNISLMKLTNLVVERNKRYEKNFKHLICNSFAVYSDKIGSKLSVMYYL